MATFRWCFCWEDQQLWFSLRGACLFGKVLSFSETRFSPGLSKQSSPYFKELLTKSKHNIPKINTCTNSLKHTRGFQLVKRSSVRSNFIPVFFYELPVSRLCCSKMNNLMQEYMILRWNLTKLEEKLHFFFFGLSILIIRLVNNKILMCALTVYLMIIKKSVK